MTEYIKREEALKHKRKMSGADWGGEFWDEAVLCEDIHKMPAADVVEVVRCCNCIYLKTNINKENYCDRHSSTWDKFYVRLDDFCSYGKRIRGANNGKD